jgi:hypothetical protein
MLLIFTFSILPRKYLHDAFSHHTDSFHLYEQNKGATVEQKSFQCDQFTMVADHHFIGTIPISFEGISPFIQGETKSFYRSTLFSGRRSTSLRGPPSLLWTRILFVFESFGFYLNHSGSIWIFLNLSASFREFAESHSAYAHQ